MARINQAPMKRNALAVKYGQCCVACGAIHDLTLDHIIPHAKGGNDRVYNLQILCRECNVAKDQLVASRATLRWLAA